MREPFAAHSCAECHQALEPVQAGATLGRQHLSDTRVDLGMVVDAARPSRAGCHQTLSTGTARTGTRPCSGSNRAKAVIDR